MTAHRAATIVIRDAKQQLGTVAGIGSVNQRLLLP
jgi:hypothetical protein